MQSENINELITALSKVQGQLKGALKDSVNPHFKSKYADLGSIWEACREPLSENGLAVVQTLSYENDRQMLVTTLGHISGQWMRSVMALPTVKPGAQEVGSCITYCRRYSLAAIIGVCQEDDDGERAESSYREPKFLSQAMVASISPYFAQDPEAVQMVKDRFKIDAWTKIPHEKFGDVLGWLRGRKEQREQGDE